ncbi:MAG: hypothetical protein RL199_1243 [Pseudomonadota bacterium]
MKPDRIAVPLFAWNPLNEPQTIRVHVEDLNRSGAPAKCTWWGRISKDAVLTDSDRDRKLGGVPELLKGPGSPRIALVTDFTSLHVLFVDGLELPRPGTPVDRGPDYYRREKVILWLRVRDIRGVFHHNVPTLEYLLANVFPSDDAARGFDPYSSSTDLSRNPRVVWLERKTYDELSSPCPEGLWSEQPGVVGGRAVEVARDKLKKRLGSDVWDKLDEKSRSFLATAQLQFDGFGHVEGVDFGPIVLQACKAVENELVGLSLAPLFELAAGRTGGVPEDVAALASFGRAVRPPLTLGTLSWALENRLLDAWIQRRREDNAFARLLGDAAFQDGFAQLVSLRNGAAHPGGGDAVLDRAWTAALLALEEPEAGRRGLALRDIVTAKASIHSDYGPG